MVTITKLLDWLKQFPPESNVRGYEGEGGAWIVVDLPDGSEDAIHTEEMPYIPKENRNG